LSDEQIAKAIELFGEEACNNACAKLGFKSLKDIPVSRKSEFAKLCKE
jgi:hypothetical protein